ncbi:bifunctional demethylmenaquinone methyltransferase/2-methoxy-6-polyprenyl-1,4-benzoquinol methylase UbiE [Solitalea lacus]|uniref:bifunctional demethylmenaquinone methyltransferase/2-methoxy-6-polyprenyl-1,4-benzoquinol methylase UbiE n=1 Tax=Solitalea lacus TaxID=2911172 RepID=UPI001EDABA77|nr:bifunctional demethylmenaquinone methyltransferase/2-methoxy-6-polyprenyl-1,4-benzoquinol methylase UbiE [Solitalea lacus]UKJ08857.1 bifunctional demethylmenaquinone methyltransferase/2-methoxy-6-polyprenyl-1,4-benzoquinol methylase UbiE [Solitalea lacus]
MAETIKPYKELDSTKKEQVAQMFDKIAGKYDFLNHFLSLGIDIWWRKKAIAELKSINPKYILDVATGTGDLAFQAIETLKPEKVIGVDISEGMLSFAEKKIAERNLQNVFSVNVGDSENLPFEDNTFDAVIVSFGVRNFENLEKGLVNIQRVLKPGGKAVVLEFSKPTMFPFKQLYNFYFFNLLPFIGKMFSKDNSAYTYLPESVHAFPDGEKFTDILQRSGFKETKIKKLTLGISSIYTGIKPAR